MHLEWLLKRLTVNLFALTKRRGRAVKFRHFPVPRFSTFRISDLGHANAVPVCLANGQEAASYQQHLRPWPSICICCPHLRLACPFGTWGFFALGPKFCLELRFIHDFIIELCGRSLLRCVSSFIKKNGRKK